MTKIDLISVMIVDDHIMFRAGLKALFSAFPDLELIAETGCKDEAIYLFKTFQPDVVLLDLMLPNMDGIAILRTFRAHNPHIRVIVLTSCANNICVHKALDAGAIGFLHKTVSSDKLVQAIRSAYAGRLTLSSKAMVDLILVTTNPPLQLGNNLTAREQEVLPLIVEGLNNDNIAKQLNISPATVNYHVGNILSKLRVSNRTKAAILAVKSNLVP